MSPTTQSQRPSKRLAVFCDGTWVGRETHVQGAPDSNIRQLADMVGEVRYLKESTEATVHPIHVKPRQQANGPNPINGTTPSTTQFAPANASSIVAGYQEGFGLNSNFLNYVWDGATAASIGDECIAVYRFIVENFTQDHEIWLFGFSRGSYTVRCVAGMINNCGIVKRLPEYSEEEVQDLCTGVFKTYRSALPRDRPHSGECEEFKGDASRVWQVRRPIRFMGLIDTVGALGIPRLSAGIGFDFTPLEFFDQHVSSVVQHVYHAPCLHDRLWFLQPCLVYPGKGVDAAQIHERWFPGTHYDVGRQTFRFIKQHPTNWIEGLLGWLPDLLSKTIYPNEVLGDCVLRWLVEGIRDVEGESLAPIIADTKAQLQRLDERLVSRKPSATGSGDIYGNALDYAPGGVIWSAVQRISRAVTSVLNRILPRLGDNIQQVLGIKSIIGILMATTDRRLPGVTVDVYPYLQDESVSVNGTVETFNVAQKAGLKGTNRWGKPRYPSKTFESFLLWRQVFGRQGAISNNY